MLETLAKAEFPIDPELEFDSLRELSYIRFPVPVEQHEAIEDLLRACGFANAFLGYEEPGEASLRELPRVYPDE
ncbi:MAG: hypothetical protein OHK0021_20690 [Bryobacter sp.]